MTISEALCTVIQTLVRDSVFTFEEFAKRSLLSSDEINQIASGTFDPDLDKLCAMGNTLNLPPSEIIQKVEALLNQYK